MSGKPGRSGRPRTPANQVGLALEQVKSKLPEIIDALILRAINGDGQAQIYLINRIMGNPRVEIDQTTKTEITLSDDLLASIAQRTQTLAREAVESNSERLLEESILNHREENNE